MKRVRQIHGFTLLEVLTAMAIVALMIGLLIPAIGMIQKSAQTVKQRAQFHAIDVSLEAFRMDVGDYPPSNYTLDSNPSPTTGGTDGYCGAQKLAEALIGMDGFGFHPKSQWRTDELEALDTNGDGNIDTYNPLYYGRTAAPTLESQAQNVRDENLKSRKGPYLELEKANAVKLKSLYSEKWGSIGGVVADTFVLCDMFGQAKTVAGKKAGLPILYFRADTNNTLFSPTTLGARPWPTGSWPTSPDAIYNVNENFPFLENMPNGYPFGSYHPMGDVPSNGRALFYKRIANPNFTNPQRPYRAQSYILLSAGGDGLYGTSDDVYNFDENEK
jgi:prepilin-type N-terminal cleavage/methylation domain-containing protein